MLGLPFGRAVRAAAVVVLALGVPACSCSTEPAPSASAAGSAPADSAALSASATTPPPAWLGIPKPADDVIRVLTPKMRSPYDGKTGTLKGRVTMKGDPAPLTEWSFPTSCPDAAAIYGRAFRVGQDDGLADALVLVADYDAFVPPDKPSITVKARGCAFESRTIGMTYGQRLDVVNYDATGSYMPYLDGAEYRAVMVAVPNGEPVKVYPHKPAINYVLRDYGARPFMQADVLALKFATHDVTDLGGAYEIGRIPVGKVKVQVYLPALDKSVFSDFEIKEGENTLDLEMTYDKEKDKVVPRPPDPFARGTDPNKEAAEPGKFGAPPKRVPNDVPH